MSYKTIIEEWLLHWPTKELSKEAKECYQKWYNIKTLIEKIKGKLKLITEKESKSSFFIT